MTNTIEGSGTKYKQIAMSLMTNTMECGRTKYKQIAMSSMTNIMEGYRRQSQSSHRIEYDGRPWNNSHKESHKRSHKDKYRKDRYT